MIFIVPLILIVMCICCCMMSSGAVIINRANDPNRNLTVDYFLYFSLCMGCALVLLLTIPPLVIGYNFFNFFGLA